MTNPILKDGERIDQLFSTDVKIIQNKEVFSYSIDSVLLSRFPKIPKKGLIVDLCSGNGAVGLFASTRTEAPITLVELQERLADMAQRSVPHDLRWTLSSVTLPTLRRQKHLRRICQSTTSWPVTKSRLIWKKFARSHVMPLNLMGALPWCIALTAFWISLTPCASII